MLSENAFWEVFTLDEAADEPAPEYGDFWADDLEDDEAWAGDP